MLDGLTILESYISYMDNIFNILDKNRTNKSHVILQKKFHKAREYKRQQTGSYLILNVCPYWSLCKCGVVISVSLLVHLVVLY